MNIKIYPSVIAANFFTAPSEIKKLEPYVEGFHLDVMDTHFVPNLALSPKNSNEIRKQVASALFVHLMVTEPLVVVPLLELDRSDAVVFHYEAANKQQELLAQIKNYGVAAGLAVSPATPLSMVEPLLGLIDHLLIMTVVPGFSGQAFLPDMLHKIEQACMLRDKHAYHYVITADGGINATTLPSVVHAGADIVAVGSAIFGTPDPVAAVTRLRSCLDKSLLL